MKEEVAIDYAIHNDELQFKLLLRQRLTRLGVGSVMDELTDELLALAQFLEESDDHATAAIYRTVSRRLGETADEIIKVLNEK